MTNVGNRGRRGKPPRQKTPEQRRQYVRQIGSRETSGTADMGFEIPVADDSTASIPSIVEEVPVGAGVRGNGGSSWWGGMTAAATLIASGVAAVGMLGGAILYITNMKSEIAANTAAIKSLEKSQENLEAGLRREIDRVENVLERRLGDLLTYLRGRPAAGVEREGDKRGGAERK